MFGEEGPGNPKGLVSGRPVLRGVQSMLGQREEESMLGARSCKVAAVLRCRVSTNQASGEVQAILVGTWGV